MKAFKIKKRTNRQPYFIVGPSVGSYQKPNLSYVLFTKIHKPNLIPNISEFQIISNEVVAEAVVPAEVVPAEVAVPAEV